ncbi:hypothetical protein [Ulvibacterium sp.]|uniref:hypothetical protein n=1 Tax=Ulvibacterium sp. TaxID=2665914 RepID=UPI00262709D8|nr:hypothetical protein [Ulvibacterium sp.]
MNDKQDIHPIYHNPFGVAFQWKKNDVKDTNKVQLVFRDTGLLLSRKELTDFQKSIKCTIKSSTLCKNCPQDESRRALLLDTPAPQVTLAVSPKELNVVDDLVEGTLFQLQLDHLLYGS